MTDPDFLQIPDDCRIKTQWRDGRLHVVWHKDGEAIAGIVIAEEPARLTAAVISVAVSEEGKTGNHET